MSLGNLIFKQVRTSLHTRIAIVSTQLNDFNYCFATFINLFNINH